MHRRRSGPESVFGKGPSQMHRGRSGPESVFGKWTFSDAPQTLWSGGFAALSRTPACGGLLPAASATELPYAWGWRGSALVRLATGAACPRVCWPYVFPPGQIGHGCGLPTPVLGRYGLALSTTIWPVSSLNGPPHKKMALRNVVAVARAVGGHAPAREVLVRQTLAHCSAMIDRGRPPATAAVHDQFRTAQPRGANRTRPLKARISGRTDGATRTVRVVVGRPYGPHNVRPAHSWARPSRGQSDQARRRQATCVREFRSGRGGSSPPQAGVRLSAAKPPGARERPRCIEKVHFPKSRSCRVCGASAKGTFHTTAIASRARCV